MNVKALTIRVRRSKTVNAETVWDRTNAFARPDTLRMQLDSASVSEAMRRFTEQNFQLCQITRVRIAAAKLPNTGTAD